MCSFIIHKYTRIQLIHAVGSHNALIPNVCSPIQGYFPMCTPASHVGSLTTCINQYLGTWNFKGTNPVVAGPASLMVHNTGDGMGDHFIIDYQGHFNEQ